MNSQCPFCEITVTDITQRIIRQNEFAFVIRDGYPIADGHTLVIPKRHIASFFDTTEPERHALFSLVDQEKEVLDNLFKPQGYNIGINDGPAAGQTVPHLHIHIIPRYKGDVDDPRGGIRWLMPDKAKYWV